jgi:hypothetical protein
LYAEALIRSKRFDDAFNFISGALEEAMRKGQWFILPEYYRVKGEVTALRGGLTAIEDATLLLREGLDLACQQGSLSWELRSAISLARLSRAPFSDGFQELAATYARLTDGYDTEDLMNARELLTVRQQGPHAGSFDHENRPSGARN